MLAEAVINQALVDLTSKTSQHKYAARRFFKHPDFEFWCDLADTTPATVISKNPILNKV